jgi:hypothetical protein
VEDPVGRTLALVVGAGIVCFAGYFGVEALNDYLAFGDTPTRSSLVEAADAAEKGRRWVAVEGAPWRCDEIRGEVPGGVAFVPAREGSTIVVARFDHAIDCEATVAAPLVGIVEPMSRSRERDLRRAGLAAPDAARLRTLDVCASCGKSNSLTGVVVCAVFLLVGLGLYPLRRASHEVARRVRGTFDDMVTAPPHRAAEVHKKARLIGLAVVAIGGAGFFLGEGWVAYGFIPVRWIGVVGACFGAWMLVSPASYLAVRRKHRRPR